MDKRKNQPVQVELGQKFPLTIKRLGINGEGIGYFKHKIVFVPQALPGEIITAKVTDVTNKFIRAQLQRLRQASPDRVQPKDPLYGQVGGLELAHMRYSAQLAFKRDVVRQALEKFKPTGFQHYELRPTIAGEPFHYRNKAQFPVQRVNGKIIAGLYEEGTHHLVDIQTISTQMPQVDITLQQLKQVLQAQHAPIYDEKAHKDGIRTLVVRVSASRPQIQVTLVASNPGILKAKPLFTAIKAQIPTITSLFININPEDTSLIWGEQTIHIFGAETITEQIGDKIFELSPRAFFQLNPKQTQKLYHLARSAFNFKGTETLVDAYCGIGTLGIIMADAVKNVRGMDIVAEGIADARKNAALNHLTNCHYEVGAAEVVLTKWLNHKEPIDALVVDPPRTGLAPELTRAIVKAHPRQFVYISCNPSTLARDLRALSHAYQVNYIQSIDMFPQTARCEAVVKLTLKSQNL